MIAPKSLYDWQGVQYFGTASGRKKKRLDSKGASSTFEKTFFL